MKNNFTAEWDYKGWMAMPNGDEYQDDWNHTLLTTLNRVSAQIYQSTLIGGANKIKIHPSVFNILKKIEFLNVTDEGEFIISGRYTVDMDKNNPRDKIYVYQNDVSFGEITIKNFN